MMDIIKHDGAWTIARTVRNGLTYRIEIKHFELPSEFGIRNGRISKLWIAEVHGEGKYKCVCSYDRGWDRRATTTVARAIRDEAIKIYN